MGMSDAELDRLKAVEQELDRLMSQSLATVWKQLSWLRSELGKPPQFDTSQAHESAVLKRIEDLEAKPGSNLSLDQIANGLKIAKK